MYTFAFLLLTLAMLTSLGGAAAVLWGAGSSQTGANSGVRLAEKAGLAQAVALGLASLILLYALTTKDFSLVYVASYTDSTLPIFYRLTAFWAGQAGSILFWALSVGLSGAVFQRTKAYGALTRATQGWYWVFFLTIMAFFGLLLVAWNNPFLVYHAAPADGNGLNPLLQNPGMLFHPPLLFLGYGGFVIPGCLALGQALSGRRTEEASWTELSRPFTLAAWGLLSAGIVLGGWWAYMELGWGGYWAWDPVENASLIPWLIATAALHTQLIESRRRKLRGTNIFLMALTTVSAFFATYLVRSGVVQSVHAFGTGGIGAPLLFFIGMFTLLAVYCARQGRDPEAESLAGLESREGFLVLTAWLLLALSVIILLATMWPVFTAFWRESVMGLAREAQLDAAGHDHGGAVGLTAAFYNRVCLPLFTGLVTLLALCPWLRWQGGIRKIQGMGLTVAVLLLALGGLWYADYRLPVAILAAASGVAVLAGLGLLVLEPAVRAGRSTMLAFAIHGGVALMALGIAFSGPYKQEDNFVLGAGEKAQVGGYDVTLAQLYQGTGPGYKFIEAEVRVSRNGKDMGTLSPQRRIYDKWNQMQFAEASTIFSPGNEVYASLLGVDKDSRVRLLVSINPLVNWIWIGGTLLSVLPFFMLFRRRANSAKG